jgi:hypothetical protein
VPTGLPARGGNDLTPRRLRIVMPELTPSSEAIVGGVEVGRPALRGMWRKVDVRDGPELCCAAGGVEQHSEPFD